MKHRGIGHRSGCGPATAKRLAVSAAMCRASRAVAGCVPPERRKRSGQLGHEHSEHRRDARCVRAVATSVSAKWVFKPGSVPFLAVTIPLGEPLLTRSSNLPAGSTGRLNACCLVLLRMGFTEPPGCPERWCALTAPFHPYLIRRAFAHPAAIGGLLSVALSVASRRLAVSQHPALWSPDFPPPTLR